MWNLVIPAVTSLLDKVIPDPQAASDAKLKMLEMAQKGELASLDADLRLALGQIEVNKTEASSQDWFRGGWRPAVGWVCVIGLFYQFLMRPLLPWVVAVAGAEVPPLPAIDADNLYVLLSGLLGLGGLRTFERVRGKIA